MRYLHFHEDTYHRRHLARRRMSFWYNMGTVAILVMMVLGLVTFLWYLMRDAGIIAL